MFSHLFFVLLTVTTLSAAAPKTVTFPSQVKTREVEALQEHEVSEVEALLKAEGLDLDAEEIEGFKTQLLNGEGPLHIVQFLAQLPRRPKNYHIKMPATGDFKLTLQAGSRYAILDNDATDGEAKIQLPSGTLKTWLHLNKNWRKDSELGVEDALYYVQDTLSSARKKLLDSNRWLKLGLRPLPVPSDWESEAGEQWVLNFSAKDAVGFEMVWLNRKHQQADFPPGIKEIGPEGGTLELPGVASLTIPAGAMTTKQTVALKQVFEAASMEEYCISPDDCYPGWVFAAPIVKILPLGLELIKPGLLDLPSYQKYVDNIPPSMFRKVASRSAMNNLLWSYSPFLATEFDYEIDDFAQANSKIPVKILSYITKRISFTPDLEQFSIKQNNESSCMTTLQERQLKTEHFVINSKSVRG